MSGRTGIVLDGAYIKHELDGHIERPDRVRKIALSLCESGLEGQCTFVTARRATKPEVCLAHTPQVALLPSFLINQSYTSSWQRQERVSLTLSTR